MSYALRQALLIGLGGAVFAGIIVLLARRQLISLRYALGWTLISFTGLLGAAVTPLVTPLAAAFGMSPTGVLLAGATIVLLGITLQLSVSVSGLQAQVRDVAEAHALLARRLQDQQSDAVDR